MDTEGDRARVRGRVRRVPPVCLLGPYRRPGGAPGDPPLNRVADSVRDRSAAPRRAARTEVNPATSRPACSCRAVRTLGDTGHAAA